MKEAILKAGPVRLRPILMTTIAMILGMLPSAMARGEGSEFRSPISIATIGGLITSTLLTLVVVPVAYLLLARGVERVKAWRATPARVPQAVRVTGVILLVAALGWLLSATTAFAQTAPASQLASDRRAGDGSADLRPGARTRALEQRGAEGRERTRGRNAGPRAGSQDQLPAAGEPRLQLHAGAALSGHQDPGRRIRPRGTDVPGGVRTAERPAALRQPADLHRRPPEQRLRHHHLVARRLEARARSHAAGDRIPRRRDLLLGADERARRRGGRRTDSDDGDATPARASAVRIRHGRPARRVAGGSRARQRQGTAHPAARAGRYRRCRRCAACCRCRNRRR